MENEIVLYQPDELTKLEVRVENETVWLSQDQMSQLFDKDQSVIARHIRNAIQEGEVDENSNMQILHNTLSKYKPTKVYSLDVIISVGYRVHSVQGVSFRRWATSVLKDYMLRGYAVNQHNAQYRPIEIKQTKVIHDRFLIIDEVVYYIGASIKDLGKRLFAFSKMEMGKEGILRAKCK